MNPDTNAQIVSRLFLATGRKPELATFAVWEEALDDLEDGPALEAAMQVIRTTDMTFGPPSPVMVRDVYQAIMRRRDDSRPALVEETDPVVADPVTARAGIEAALNELTRRQRVPAGSPAYGLYPRPTPDARPGVSAHDFGQHDLCGIDCPDRPPAHVAPTITEENP